MATQKPAVAIRLGRPRASEEAERHQHILAQAVAAFTANGFQGTSIESVARLAGVSKMTIYNRFGDKEGLFQAIAQQICAPASSRVASVRVAGRPAQDILQDIAHALLEKPRDDKAFRLLRLAIFEQERFPDLARAIHAASLVTLAPLTRCMQALIDEGQFTPADAGELAELFFAMVMRGHRFLLVNDTADGSANTDFTDRVVRLFVHGARRR